MRRRAAVIAGLVGLIAVVIVLGTATTHTTPSRPAPALPAQVLHGPAVTVASLAGHPTLVNFWASWCHPCRQEAPELERFAAAHAGVRIVGVDTGDNAADARAFLRRYGWSFPVLRDRDAGVGDRYGIQGLPTTFVLDARGRIVSTLSGVQTRTSLERALQSAQE